MHALHGQLSPLARLWLFLSTGCVSGTVRCHHASSCRFSTICRCQQGWRTKTEVCSVRLATCRNFSDLFWHRTCGRYVCYHAPL